MTVLYVLNLPRIKVYSLNGDKLSINEMFNFGLIIKKKCIRVIYILLLVISLNDPHS